MVEVGAGVENECHPLQTLAGDFLPPKGDLFF